MSKGLRSSLWIMLLLAILGGCSMAEVMAPTPKETLFLSPLPLPQHTAYVLSGILGGTNTFWLTLLDADTWQVIRRVELPQAYTTHLSRDPQGRLWIGYLGLDWTEYRMQVFAPDGRLLQTLHPCQDPESGVQFANGRAFIACDENGFYGSLAVVDLATLSSEPPIRLEAPHEIYFVYGSGGDEHQVLILGTIHRPGGIDSNALMFIDPQKQPFQPRMAEFKDTFISDVLAYQGQYYLLNVSSWRSPREKARDILVVTPSESSKVTSIKAPAPGPTWGKIVDDTLYTYHNPAWNQFSQTPSKRILARLDLKTGASQVWRLPDNWDANDLEVVNGKVILLKDDGVYEFNPANGQLQKRAAISIPRQIVVTP